MINEVPMSFYPFSTYHPFQFQGFSGPRSICCFKKFHTKCWNICCSQIRSFRQGSGWKFWKYLKFHHLHKKVIDTCLINATQHVATMHFGLTAARNLWQLPKYRNWKFHPGKPWKNVGEKLEALRDSYLFKPLNREIPDILCHVSNTGDKEHESTLLGALHSCRAVSQSCWFLERSALRCFLFFVRGFPPLFACHFVGKMVICCSFARY